MDYIHRIIDIMERWEIYPRSMIHISFVRRSCSRCNRKELIKVGNAVYYCSGCNKEIPIKKENLKNE